MKASEPLQNDQSTATEDALHRAVDTTPAFIHTARPDGYIDYFNRGWLDFFGKSLEDVCGWRWTETVHPEDVAAIVQKWHAALASGEPFEIESRVRRADGSYRALLHRKLPLRDEHGNIVKWFGSSTDIEDRKCAEQRMAEKASELERSEFYLREGERLAHMGSWSLRPDGIFDYWSPETFAIFGFDPGNGIPTLKQWLSLLHPVDRDAVNALIGKMFSDGVKGDIRYRVHHPKHGQKTMHSTGEPLFEHDKVARLIGNTLDITEQENTARQLRRREAYLAEAQSLSHTGSFGWDVSSGEIYWSDETFLIFELDPKTEITTELIVQRTHPDDRLAVRQVIERASRDRTEFALEHRLLMPDGSIKYVQVVGRPSPDEGHRSEFVGAVTDITDQKRAEESLRESESYLAEAQRLSHTGSWSWSPDTDVRYWSEECYRVLGFDPRDGLPRTEELIQRIHPDDQPAFRESVKRATHTKLDEEVDYRIVHPGGAVRDIHSIGHPVFSPCGDLIEYTGTVIDITERKRAEALFAGEKRLLEMIATGVALNEILNALCLIIEEYRPGTLASILLLRSDGLHLESVAGPSLPKKWREEMERLPIGPCAGSCGTAAYRGSPVMVSDIAADPLWEVPEHRAAALSHGLRASWSNPILSSDGKVLGTFCIYGREARSPSAQDLGLIEKATHLARVAIERDRAEEKIREQETELRQILDLTPQHHGVLAPDGSRLYANHAALEYLGITLEQWRKPGKVPERVHPEDREHFLYERDRRFLEGKPHEFEARLLRHDGEFRWFLFRLTPLKDERGHITRWYGTATDIEDRKRAEEEIRKENIVLREELGKTSMFEEVIGTSSALQMVLARAAKVAPTDSTVLIMGETGTGKELIARAIHKRSKRSARPFISVNCAAVPSSLIMSELFGHEKGAFTGAVQRRLGRFELSEGGTIFLDEVGELPMETQIALLRVLQEREFERVGGTEVLRADVRVISATNRDLQAAIADGAFRSDLYYRLNVFPIKLPPLRERKEDVPLLVNYFVDRYATRAGKKIKHIQKKALEALREYSWPGNVRELQNVIERSLIIGETNEFTIDKSWVANEPQSSTAATERKSNERQRIEAALAQSNGKIAGASGAAAKLGIPASTLESKIRTLRINKFQFKGV